MTAIPVPCPDAEKPNEFGVTNNYSISCSVLHTKTEISGHEKEFLVKDSAIAFFKRAKEQNSIRSVKLDSILIDTKNP